MSCALLALALIAGAPPSPTLIHAGRLVDGQTGAVAEKVSIAVSGDTVKSVQPGFRAARPGERLIDLSKMTVLPGLVDAHTHITGQQSPKSYAERLFMEPADYAFRSTLFARRTVHAGFTAIRDLGDRYNVSISLEKAIRAGWVVGPRIYTSAKALASTGGHADPTNGIADPFAYEPGPAHGVLDGPFEARAAVRQRYKDGAHLIKITATGGVLSLAKNGQNPQFQLDELEEIVKTARDYGMRIAVHAHGAEGMKRALRAGVDSIEHGTYMDDEAITLFRKTGTYYVPTLLAGAFVAEQAKTKGYFPDVVRPKAIRIGAELINTFRKAHRAGVRIAFGTDTGVSAHGDNAQEFALMVEGGMTPIEAILSSTKHAANLVGDARLGRVDEGSYADIIAVAGDPLRDIRELERVRFVMKGGEVLRPVDGTE